jgi:hypothetical protein
MNAEHSQTDFGATQSLSAHLLNLPPAPRYETAGARSTRMIIDSASYSTTPSCSPPPEPSHVFSPYDTHRKAPGVAALTEADHVLEKQMNQNELGHYITSSPAQSKAPALQISVDAPSDRIRHRQGVIPPYMLQAIAASGAAGPQARASAEQTLSSLNPAKHNRASNEDFAPIAPAQRQLMDGRWVIGF